MAKYDAWWLCTNCNCTGATQIPKGTLAADYFKTMLCPACGCMTLKVKP